MQPAVGLRRGDHILVRTQGLDATTVENENLVGEVDGRQTVGDDVAVVSPRMRAKIDCSVFASTALNESSSTTSSEFFINARPNVMRWR